MSDPLSLLREYNINKKEIFEKDGRIIFGEVSWQKNVKTKYATHRSGKNGYPTEHYTLECLLYLLKNATLYHPIYCRQAAADNIPAVRRPDRKNVLKYLNGETASCLSAYTSSALEIPIQVKRSAVYGKDKSKELSKKPRFEDRHVQKVKEKLDAPKEASLTVDKHT